jgi:hypothetical protein
MDRVLVVMVVVAVLMLAAAASLRTLLPSVLDPLEEQDVACFLEGFCMWYDAELTKCWHLMSSIRD